MVFALLLLHIGDVVAALLLLLAGVEVPALLVLRHAASESNPGSNLRGHGVGSGASTTTAATSITGGIRLHPLGRSLAPSLLSLSLSFSRSPRG
jgi:hypothetical protein